MSSWFGSERRGSSGSAIPGRPPGHCLRSVPRSARRVLRRLHGIRAEHRRPSDRLADRRLGPASDRRSDAAAAHGHPGRGAGGVPRSIQVDRSVPGATRRWRSVSHSSPMPSRVSRASARAWEEAALRWRAPIGLVSGELAVTRHHPTPLKSEEPCKRVARRRVRHTDRQDDRRSDSLGLRSSRTQVIESDSCCLLFSEDMKRLVQVVR